MTETDDKPHSNRFSDPDMADFSVRVADWFEKLRDNICGQFETIESEAEGQPII